MVNKKRKPLRVRKSNNMCANRLADTTKLSETAKQFALQLPAPTTSELIINAFNGDKQEAARQLSQVTGIKYKSMLDTLTRYLANRATPSKKRKELFKQFYIPDAKSNLKIQIRGCVLVSSEYYYKESTWHNPIMIARNDVIAFLELAQESNSLGYEFLNGMYMRTGIRDSMITWLDNVEIRMSF